MRKRTMRFYLVLVVLLLAGGLAVLSWSRLGQSKRMEYTISADGMICGVGRGATCVNLISGKGSIAFPDGEMASRRVASMTVGDGTQADVLVRAMNYFAVNDVAGFIVRRKGGGRDEHFRFVAPLMGIGANGPVRLAMNHAPAGYLDPGGMIALEGFHILSVQTADQKLFFGDREVSDQEIRDALKGAKLSAITVLLRKGSDLAGIWRLMRVVGDRDVEVILLTSGR